MTLHRMLCLLSKDEATDLLISQIYMLYDSGTYFSFLSSANHLKDGCHHRIKRIFFQLTFPYNSYFPAIRFKSLIVFCISLNIFHNLGVPVVCI